MKRVEWCLAGIVAVWAATTVTPPVAAETCTLKLERLPPAATGGSRSDSRAEWLYRATSSQSFFRQFGVKRAGDPTEEFRTLVRKEPEKYQAQEPFRGVAKLGTGKFLFVLDAKDDKSQGYNRLYFDRNANGDLTDDEPIDAETPNQPGVKFPAGYARYQFPRVDLTIELDGRKAEYAFYLNVYSNENQQFHYVSVSLNAAAYRAGEITLAGKPHKLALVDYNSNGRFNEESRVSEQVRGSEGQVYPQYGDVLLVDPEQAVQPTGLTVASSPDACRQWVSKLASIDGRIYELKISPTGDELTLTPSTVQLGHLSNPNAPFSAMIYGDRGFLQIRGEANQPVPVPEGQWKLLSYTLQRTDWKEPTPPAKPPENVGQESPVKGVIEAITKVLTGDKRATTPEVRYGPAGVCSVSGTGTVNYPPVTVRSGETVLLPFGPPYKPVVKAAVIGQPGGGLAPLALSIVGSGGEVVTNLIVDGKRPPKPQFTIIDPQGETVQEGSFEYG